MVSLGVLSGRVAPPYPLMRTVRVRTMCMQAVSVRTVRHLHVCACAASISKLESPVCYSSDILYTNVYHHHINMTGCLPNARTTRYINMYRQLVRTPSNRQRQPATTLHQHRMAEPTQRTYDLHTPFALTPIAHTTHHSPTQSILIHRAAMNAKQVEHEFNITQAANHITTKWFPGLR